MCRLVSVKTSEGIDINVADIKAVIIEQISTLASECNKIDESGSVCCHFFIL